MNYEDELDRSRARKSRRRESESETSAKRRTHRTEDLYSMTADPGSRPCRSKEPWGSFPQSQKTEKRKQEEKDHHRCSDRPDRSGPGFCRSGIRLYPAQLRKDERTE